MPRIPGVPIETVPAFIREKMDDEVQRYGQVLDATRIRARIPALVEGWAAMNAAVVAGGRIPASLRVLLYRRVALSIHCSY